MEHNKRDKFDWKEYNKDFIRKTIRFNKNEWSNIETIMKEIEEDNFSSFAKKMFTEKKVVINKFESNLSLKAIKDLKKIGVNINQIAFKINGLSKNLESKKVALIENEVQLFLMELHKINKFCRDNKIQ